MADTPDLEELVSALAGNIDDLEDSLRPIFISSVAKASGKLPLLDKAKIHVLMSYTIESIIFSSLRLSNTDAKNHPVFNELARVRQYFEKIKEAESGPSKRENMSLDKAAAGRIIRHALAGNARLDQEPDAAAARGPATAQGKWVNLDPKTTDREPSGTADSTARAPRQSSGHGRKRKNANNMWDDQASSNSASDAASAAKSGKRSSSKRRKRSKSSKAPRDAHAAFESLLKGPGKGPESSK